MVDDKKSTEQQVKQLMKELKIDVDNLCSFMPQDKVGNFSQQTPQGILQKTLEAISSLDVPDKNLHEIQMELADEEGLKNKYSTELDSKRKALNTIENQLSEMQTDVRRMEERDGNIKLLELLRVKLCVTESTEHKAKLEDADAKVKEADKELAEKEESISPMETLTREIKIKMTTREKACENIHSKFTKTQKDIQDSRKEMDDIDVKFDDISNRLKSILTSRKNLEKAKADYEKEIAAVLNTLDDLRKKMPQINKQIDELTPSIQKKVSECNSLDESMEDLKDQMKRIDSDMSLIGIEMRKVKDPHSIFKKNLMALDAGRHESDAKFMDRVAKEIENGGFKKEVYGPVGAYLNFKDAVVAAMAEKAIPRGKLIGYVAQTTEDEAKLRSMNKDINIYTMLNISKPDRPYSRQTIEGLKDIGMQGYLTDEIECPEVVKGFLHDICNLSHHIWARTDSHSRINLQHFENLCPPSALSSSPLSMFVHATGGGAKGGGLELHTGQRSKYANANLSLKTETPPPMPRILHAGGTSSDASTGRAELEEKLASLTSEKSALNSRLKKIQAEHAKVFDEKNVLQTTIKTLRDSKKVPDVQESRLKGLKAKLVDVEKRLTKDPVQETADLCKHQRECLSIRFQCANDVATVVTERGNIEIQLGVEEEALRLMRQLLNEQEDALSEARITLNELKDKKKQTQKKRDDAKKKMAETQALFEELVTKIGGRDKFRMYYIDVVSNKVPEKTAEDIQARIAAVQVQLENVQDDPEIIRRHKKLLKDREEKDIEVKRMEDEFQNMREHVENRSLNWLNQVGGVTEKLSNQFNRYMSDLSYEGAVRLVKKSTIDKYEMQMKVKFRETDVLMDLSGHRHSGGERAVSTIMYLMALQEMTHAPFRAVDEINQGMDERNERLVFDRIVQSCCSEKNKPQYFLVSPKLLQG